MRKVALVHTGFALVNVLGDLFKEIIPSVEIINIVDDSLLREVLENNKVTKNVTRRMISYFKAAEEYGVDCILNVCSSVGEVADIVREIIDTKVIKIDEKMTADAVKKATKIGVAATLQTTLDPTCAMIEKKAKIANKKIDIKITLCPGAFEQLMSGNTEKHDEIVLKGVKDLMKNVDIVVLAQGSMARLVEKFDDKLKDVILTSPRSGVLEVKKYLKL